MYRLSLSQNFSLGFVYVYTVFTKLYEISYTLISFCVTWKIGPGSQFSVIVGLKNHEAITRKLILDLQTAAGNQINRSTATRRLTEVGMYVRKTMVCVSGAVIIIKKTKKSEYGLMKSPDIV